MGESDSLAYAQHRFDFVKRKTENWLNMNSTKLNEIIQNPSLLSERNEDIDTPNVSGLCVECSDHPEELKCVQCGDLFCAVCFQFIHKSGSRKGHSVVSLKDAAGDVTMAESDKVNATNGTKQSSKPIEQEDVQGEVISIDELLKQSGGTLSLDDNSAAAIKERAKYIPVRLTQTERLLFRLLNSTLLVSEYTDKIDIISHMQKRPRIVAQIKQICSILCGLAIATDIDKGKELLMEGKEFKDMEEFFLSVFEIGRRYKIMNPERMRDTYGKLVYMLQDSVDVEDLLGFKCVSPMRTVYSVLEENGSLPMLDDVLIEVATREIIPDGKDRRTIQKEIRQKEMAIDHLSKKYCTFRDTRMSLNPFKAFGGGQQKGLTQEEVRQCLYSIGDNSSFLRSNRDPIDKMISFLTTYFGPSKPQPTLAISAGRGGARLSHSHERQYYYVLQSLTLWREVMHNMFKLWILSENDLLNGSRYLLRDTGQGLNRVQPCPSVSREIHKILNHVMHKVGQWVGSSVVHLGDHNVPNALNFIDKYTQVSRILRPIVTCIESIDNLVKDPNIKNYIEDTFGGADECKIEILQDFFRYFPL